jgi:hypothetical protein
MPMSNDFNGEQYEGFGPFQFTIANGRRCSTAVAYLNPAMNRHNLTVMNGADVVHIKFEGKRAVGVTIDHKGRRISVMAKREVIVSSGAFNTAHGIGLVHDPASAKIFKNTPMPPFSPPVISTEACSSQYWACCRWSEKVLSTTGRISGSFAPHSLRSVDF